MSGFEKKPGDDIVGSAGTYIVIQEIGRGAYSVVYECRRIGETTGDHYAVKQLKIGMRQERVDREIMMAELLSKNPHKNIIKYEETIEENVGNGLRQQYIVMEHATNGSLAEVMEQASFSPKQCLKCALEMAEAFMHLHSLRIYHRDIKPNNMLIARDNSIRVADFGVVFLPDETRVTFENSPGTWHYMPPEFKQAKKTSESGTVYVWDAQSDIYSFGIVLKEMVELAFPDPSDGDKRATSSNSMVVPDKLKNTIKRMTQQDHTLRPQSMLNVLNDLRDVQADILRQGGGGSANSRGIRPDEDGIDFEIPQLAEGLTNRQRLVRLGEESRDVCNYAFPNEFTVTTPDWVVGLFLLLRTVNERIPFGDLNQIVLWRKLFTELSPVMRTDEGDRNVIRKYNALSHLVVVEGDRGYWWDDTIVGHIPSYGKRHSHGDIYNEHGWGIVKDDYFFFGEAPGDEDVIPDTTYLGIDDDIREWEILVGVSPGGRPLPETFICSLKIDYDWRADHFGPSTFTTERKLLNVQFLKFLERSRGLDARGLHWDIDAAHKADESEQDNWRRRQIAEAVENFMLTGKLPTEDPSTVKRS